ncbi:MAG: hypothetical protein HN742_41120 [Lentisphaerae bacterium]|jgi:hypothetical protein|nr:hypothetical protein [Lentisphaerota bacterium]MBT4818423.1 hypothetical protein [Lentisphaerota bacterium]MBT5608355.1 hypothetical protein [Lentisphaerota bacterium]MBT7060972.1 hypothetical protein [Lentisphaerota bacterium]MBT7848339.1 hypothetical protein [Lentisphaerota bacterium]
MMDNTLTDRTIASGYPWTPFRVEWRPTYGLDDRETLERAMDVFEEAGVKAWWYSAAAKGSYPLFHSEYLPYRDDADDELLKWLTSECHRRGISILSWEYLSTAPMLAAQKPEWRYRWLDHDGDTSDERENQFVCYNSPYGDLLKNYCVEVVGKLGFDGIWFDGSTLYGVSTAKRRIGCCCQYCRDAFARGTGLGFPETIDLSDATFRRYVNWRYQDFMGYWAELSEFVVARHPDKLIALNHFNRPGHGWETGCPLWRLPMKAMISTEVGAHHNHLLLHHKYHRALNDNLPVEIWDYLCDGTSNAIQPSPEPGPEAVTFLCRASATAGGFNSFGLCAAPWDVRECLTSMTQAVAPLAPYVGGEPWRCIGLVLSGATKDFAYSNSYEGWRHVHGAHNLLNGLHLPCDVILDNMLDADTLQRYQAIVLPDVQCLSEEGAAALRQYVQRGGMLLAIGELGVMDLDGDSREEGILDSLFGVAHRHSATLPPAILEPCGLLCEGSLPRAFLGAGACLPVDVSGDAEVLATVTYHTGPVGKRWSAQGLIRPDPDGTVTGVAIVARDHGRGRAIWIRNAVTLGYADQPGIRSRELVWELLRGRVQRPFETDAPPSVVIAPWQQGDRVALHVLQMPSAMLRFTNERLDRSDTYWPEDLPTLADFSISIPGDWARAEAPLEPELIEVRRGGQASTVTIRELHQHRLVVLQS